MMWANPARLLAKPNFPLVRCLLVALTAPLLAAASAWSAVADEAGYRLGTQDRLKVHVYEWPALTGEFTVGPDGNVSLPLIGQVTASGSDISELSAAISQRLKTRADLTQLPDVAVDIVQYRPFYVIGSVERAGEYAFRPGMIVLHAVGISGGVYRRPGSTDWAAERDAITSASEAELNLLKVREFGARLFRLQAEADGAAEMLVPDGPNANGEALEAEQRIFVGRKQQFETGLALLTKRITLFKDEIIALQGGAAAENRERAVIIRELNDTKELVARGLTPAPRVIPLERGLAQIDREIKENEAQTLRARQQINIAEQLIADLRDERKTSALNDIKSTQALIDEARERRRMATNLARASVSFGLAEEPKDEQGSLATLSFSITRTERGETRIIEASETTQVMPGDVVNVIRRADVGGALTSSRRSKRTVAEASGPGKETATP